MEDNFDIEQSFEKIILQEQSDNKKITETPTQEKAQIGSKEMNSAERIDSLISEVYGNEDPSIEQDVTLRQDEKKEGPVAKIAQNENIKPKAPVQKQPEEEQKRESVVFDFTSTFKQDTKAGRSMKKKSKKPVLSSQKKAGTENEDEVPVDTTDNVNKDLEDANMLPNDALDESKDPAVLAQLIPKNLQITQAEMAQRKVMDQRRWFCMARPQYPKSCGISSLVSCWNYLYTTLGVGSKQPISTEEALEVLGFQPPYQNVSFGSFTGNDTLIQWFGLLNRKYGVKGESSIVYKKHGMKITHNTDKYQAHDLLLDGLRSTNRAYIYHCYNHYMCPIGFEQTPARPIDAYSLNKDISEFDTWIIVGEISKCYPCFHTKKWEQIVTDINCAFPEFYNIRKSEVGVQSKTGKSFTEGKHKGGNLHALIEFKSL